MMDESHSSFYPISITSSIQLGIPLITLISNTYECKRFLSENPYTPELRQVEFCTPFFLHLFCIYSENTDCRNR